MDMKNKEMLLNEMYEILADFEDLSDESLIDCRDTMQSRIEFCLELL